MNHFNCNRRRALAIAGSLFAIASYGTENPTAYLPRQQVQGRIRIWGHGSREKDFIGPLVSSWTDAFRKHQPGVQFEVALRGDSTAIGGLYTGAADLALMERPPIAMELDGYRPIFGHDPFGVEIATGSLDLANHALAPVIFVHRSNPLQQLTLQQLDALIGADRKRGHPPIARWADLGVEGPCKDQPATVLMPDIESEIPQFLEEAVMGGSQKWTGRLREFGDPSSRNGAATGAKIMAALNADPCAIAIATWPDAIPEAKAVALGTSASGPHVLPTRESIAQRRYPLARALRAYVDRTPGQAVAPALREFLAFVLSTEGQSLVARDGGYYPLPQDLAVHAKESFA